MSDPLESVLKLVAEGRLTPEEAAPIIDALGKPPKAATSSGPARPASAGFATSGPTIEAGTDAGMSAGDGRTPRYARVEVRENGRRVVDLRIPISLGRFALSRVPGLSKEQIAEVEDAVSHGAHGPILDIQDTDGDGVRIVLE